MPTLSEIRAKFITIKSKFFSTRQKEADSKFIEELYFISKRDEDIFTILRNNGLITVGYFLQHRQFWE